MVAVVEGAHMMMQCPRCSTRWRVAAASPVENPLFKCGRCHHLFRQFPGAPPPSEVAPSPSRRSSAAAAEPDTLEFIFPERQPAEILLAENAPRAPSGPVVESAEPGVAVATPEATVVAVAAALTRSLRHGSLSATNRDPSARDGVAETSAYRSDTQSASCARGVSRFSLRDPSVAQTPSSAESTVTADTNDDLGDVDDAHELDSDLLAEATDDDGPVLGDLDEDDAPPEFVRPDTGRSFRVEETMKISAGFGTIMRALGVAISGFAALALVVRVAPERTSAWLSRLPVAGAGFSRDRNLASKIELRNVQGKFQRLRNARRIFVISGDARNNSPITIERIEVAGALYGLGGGELDQKVVTTGNRTALTDLSEAEIVLLQRLDPTIALAPGGTTPFLIVFLEPPRELREFSSRVLTVRPTRRASSPPVRPADSSQGSVG